MSSSQPPLNTHDEEAIRQYIKERKILPEPNPRPVDRSRGQGDPSFEAEIKGVTVKFNLGDLFRGFFYERRLKYAVSRWLQSSELGIDDIDRIRWESRLSYLDTKSFAEQLKNACKDVVSQAPTLKLWVWKRIALLDFMLFPPTGQSTDLLDTDLKLGIGITLARGFLESRKNKIREFSEDAMSQSLEASAQAVCRILGPKPEDCQIWANLMVPIHPEQLNSPFLLNSHAIANENIKRSSELWNGSVQKPDRLLIVVAETNNETNHFGFWVPVFSSSNMILPGAPYAFQEYEGSAVFKDDLPPLKGFSQDQQNAWYNYMQTRFRESLFVSIPFSLSSTSNNKSVLAVFNVNVRPTRPDSWRRAYHREWLREARDQVKLSLCQAYEAFQLKCDTFVSEEKLVLSPSFPASLLPNSQDQAQLTSSNNP